MVTKRLRPSRHVYAVRNALAVLFASTTAACGAADKQEQPAQAFCSRNDVQCSETYGFAINRAGAVRYAAKAKGLPYRTMFHNVAKRSVKDEFETTAAHGSRVSETADFIERQFGQTFVLKVASPQFVYDADRQIMSLRNDRTDVHPLAYFYEGGPTENFSVVSQRCDGVLSLKIPADDAKKVMESLEAGRLSAFYVGAYDPDFSRVAPGFAKVAPGFLSESFLVENPKYGQAIYSNLWIALDFRALDIVERASGKRVLSLMCRR